MKARTLAIWSLALVLIFVFFPAAILIVQTWGDTAELKAVFELIVVRALAEPFQAILAAIVAFSFGKFGATAYDNKNQLAAVKQGVLDKDKLKLGKFKVFD